MFTYSKLLIFLTYVFVYNQMFCNVNNKIQSFYININKTQVVFLYLMCTNIGQFVKFLYVNIFYILIIYISTK